MITGASPASLRTAAAASWAAEEGKVAEFFFCASNGLMKSQMRAPSRVCRTCGQEESSPTRVSLGTRSFLVRNQRISAWPQRKKLLSTRETELWLVRTPQVCAREALAEQVGERLARGSRGASLCPRAATASVLIWKLSRHRQEESSSNVTSGQV